MMRSVTITGYRGFKHFEMHGLGRVNLLVGKNNSGKSSVLEALALLISGADPQIFWRINFERGERFDELGSRDPAELETELSNLFSGYALERGAEFKISSTGKYSNSVSVKFVNAPLDDELIRAFLSPFALQVNASMREMKMHLPVSPKGGLQYRVVDLSTSRLPQVSQPSLFQLVPTSSMTAGALALQWSDIQLTDAEEIALRAIRILEPDVERIGSVSPLRGTGSMPLGRYGFKVKLKNNKTPVHIGSFGEGAWRLFALACCLSRCPGGFLLVDEIDTGLHHSAMADMWRMVTQTAKALNVQVFATTHSRDCVDALASVCTKGGTDISLQRIEAGKDRSISYSESEIVSAAKHDIETR